MCLVIQRDFATRCNICKKRLLFSVMKNFLGKLNGTSFFISAMRWILMGKRLFKFFSFSGSLMFTLTTPLNNPIKLNSIELN